MNRKTRCATIFVAVLCVLLTSGCYSIETEMFLEPDGSGDLVAYISMPNFPEDLKNMTKAGSTPNSIPGLDPQKFGERFKEVLGTDLPPTIKVKEAKNVERHGATVSYVVLHFDQLKDVESLLGKFMDKIFTEVFSEKELDPSLADQFRPFWKIQLEKAGDLTVFTQSFYVDIKGLEEAAKQGKQKQESANAPSASESPVKTQSTVTPKSARKPATERITRRRARGATPKDEPIKDTMKDPMEGMMKGMMDEKFMEMFASVALSALLKMRFVLHAPKQITETNADIVLNGKIAIWNASAAYFLDAKKPIAMKIAY